MAREAAPLPCALHAEGASWINLVERWFALLTEKQLRCSVVWHGRTWCQRHARLYALVALTILWPLEVFLRFRLRQATHRGDPRGYLALADPRVNVVVALARSHVTVALVSALS